MAHPPHLPRPYSPEEAALLAERFAERGAAERAYAESADGAALLAALGGNSPYLSDLAVRESGTLLRMVERGAEEAFALALDPLGRADAEAPTAAVAALLRQAKRQGALIAAVADISGAWPLDRVTGALSELADSTIDYACAHLIRSAQARGELRRTGNARDPRSAGRGSGLVVLGMGKLGGRELNYSSDVDLMVLYDPEAAAYHADRAGALYVRIARDLVKLMEERTADGYVFRTDLRLRPDPAATPLAVSIPAAITYYESLGQNWERAAMIKARPVGGDKAAGDAFLKELRPFVWRRNLDFAAIADIHSIKRQIHAHKGARGAHATIQLAGHDVKLGRGGIREIEFTVQGLQLIWGGRDPALRDPTTLGALAALVAAGKMERRAAADLADAYVFLRGIEHRLQMVADRQTHRLPEDEDGLARIAAFAGYASTEDFARAFLSHLGRVEHHYARQFESEPSLAGETGGNLVFTGVDNDPETLETLTRMGYANAASVASMVRGWHHGRARAMHSERARELMTALMPALLAAFARQTQPDQALARFDALLNRLAASVQLLSLLHRNPALLDRLAGVLGAAPQLADHVARHPAALEGLLIGTASGDGVTAAATLPALLKEARHIEEALEAARRLVIQGKFETDAATLEGTLDMDESGLRRSALADAAIGALMPHVAAEFAARHGTVPGGTLAVVALGKLGGREMLPASDLDLILVYDHDPKAEMSAARTKRGAAPIRPLPVSQYFIRLAHQVVAAITAPSGEGKLYEVDMRLRPSGSKGPVAVSLSAFRRYHAESAWTWERMALTRARVVCGTPALTRKLNQAIRTALTHPADPAKTLADAAAMRARLLRDLPGEGPWDAKLRPGGLIEVEFIAQALQLAHAQKTPAVLATTTRDALAALGRAGILTPAETAATVTADRLWRTVTGMLRLTVGRWKEESLPGPAADALLAALRGVLADPPGDIVALRARMDLVAAETRRIFEARIGRIEGALEGAGA